MSDQTVDGPCRDRASNGWIYRILEGAAGLSGLVDVHVLGPAGEHYVGTLGTLEDIARILSAYRKSCECLSGKYFWLSGLVIVSEMTRDSVFAVLADLVESGELQDAFEKVPVDH